MNPTNGLYLTCGLKALKTFVKYDPNGRFYNLNISAVFVLKRGVVPFFFLNGSEWIKQALSRGGASLTFYETVLFL